MVTKKQVGILLVAGVIALIGIMEFDGYTRNKIITSSSTDYYPHLVKFVVTDRQGSPLPLIKVSASMYETKSLDRFAALFGLNMNNSSIQNATMQGTTDTEGEVVFAMIAPVEYALTITNTTLGVNDTYLIYPTKDYYKIFTRINDPRKTTIPGFQDEIMGGRIG